MAKKLKRVVESTSYPLPNDLWLDTSGGSPVLKTNVNGDWVSVSGGSSSDGGDAPAPTPSSDDFSLKFRTEELLLENNNFAFEDGHGYSLEDIFDASEDNLRILTSILDAMLLSASIQTSFPDLWGYTSGGSFYYVSTESGFYGEMGEALGIYPKFMFDVQDEFIVLTISGTMLVDAEAGTPYIQLYMHSDGKYYTEEPQLGSV